MGVLAGVYIGIGGLLLLTVGCNSPGIAASNPGLHRMVMGSFGLPVGLILVMVCGAELFTGNVLFMTAAAVERKATLGQVLSNWVLSFTGNCVGALLLVALISGTGLLSTAAAPVALAVAKTSLTFTQAFTRAIAANCMVCMAVWMATACNSFPGKFLAAWVAVSTFTAIGFEHSIANAFMIPMGIAVGAPITVSKFLTANLLPVTLGNIIGGALLALSQGYVFGRLGKPKAEPWKVA
ncbi:MAG: Formate/nitrite transporter [Monoraphidium minutum]|nr:MAG: Formate/nitrite transporter [Monoraphidium minutum]